ncbi:MAG: hypothetical protein IIT97_03710, partial [Mycoplasmataceae bacterium]|nr:hypothetical protein [Mycoplasmataceae bacterium]
DGTYDSATERFYYVGSSGSNSILIYYKNMNDQIMYAYDISNKRFELKLLNSDGIYVERKKHKSQANNEQISNDEKQKKEKIQLFITFDRLLKYFDLVEIDYLGNIRSRKSIQDLFNKL